jgi:truncated hemoglobin YjbI
MTKKQKPITLEDYDRMAGELEVMSASIRARPEMNHHFAERLAILAAQMREDIFEQHPGVEGLSCAVKPELPE